MKKKNVEVTGKITSTYISNNQSKEIGNYENKQAKNFSSYERLGFNTINIENKNKRFKSNNFDNCDNYEVNQIKNKTATFDNKNEYSIFKDHIEGKVISNGNCSSIKEYYFKEDQNYRPYMEDYTLILDNFDSDPNKGFFMLLDGHGGTEAAEFVKENLPNIFKKKKGSFEKVVKDSFISVDNLITQQAWCKNVGTTLSLLYIIKSDEIFGETYTVNCANIGDSRVVLINDNKVTRISYDHKASDMSERIRIIKEGGSVFNGRIFGQLALSRSFGDYQYRKSGLSIEPYIYSTTLSNSKRAIIIMASDGIWDMIDDNDLIKFAKKNSYDLEGIVNNLIEHAIEKGSTDNISCLGIRLF